MARPRNKLTRRDIDAAEDGWLGDGGGLWLRTDDDGRRKRWIFKYTRGGRTTEIGLGSAADVPLAKARELRKAHMDALASGLDPLAEKRKAAVAARSRHTFAEAAEAVIAARRKAQWRTSATGRESSLADWTRTLKSDCKPLAKRHVDEIDVNDVKAVVARLWDAGQYGSFRRALKRVELVIEYALAHGWRSADNPATWRRMQHIFPAPKANGGASHAAVDWREMPAFMANLRAKETITSLALEMIVLTAARSGEVLGMRWREVDLPTATWTIPAERMKAGREHVVPLSDAAIALLKKLAAIPHKSTSFVFPGADADTPLHNQGIWARTQRLADGMTTHGFRSSFRSWASDQGIDPEVAEACLAHARGTAVQRAYDRSDLLDRRRPVLEAWSRFLSGEETAKVIKLRRAGA